jgi:uncharacterized protein (TIGR00369 family)
MAILFEIWYCKSLKRRPNMKRINPSYIEAVKRVVNTSPYFSLISMEIKYLEVGHSRLEVLLEEKHHHPFGMVHGGVFSSLVDAAAYWALYPEVPEGKWMATVEMKVNLLAPARSGKLIAEGRRIKLGRTLSLGEATVKDERGKLLAHGTGTFMIIPGQGLPESLPPIFLDDEL